MVRKSGQTDICAFILMAAMIVATGMVSGQDRALPGKEADLKIQKAERHLFRGEFDSAKALFDSLARDKTCDEKTRARAAWGRAQCLVVEKRWAASADSISGLMTSGVRTPGPAVWHAAESYWRAGLVEKAESVFRLLSTREGPLRIRAVVHRALCMAFLGRLDEAETFVVENMGLAATNDEKALLFLARSYLSYRKGRSAESAMLARSALDLAGGDMKTRCAVTVACAELSAGN